MFAAVRWDSSSTSHCYALVSGQRSHFHRRRRFPHLDQNLTAASFAPQWNAFVMRTMGDDLVSAAGARMGRDALSAAMHFHVNPSLTHPHFLAHILPRHRVAAGLPAYVGIPSHLAQLIVGVRIG